MTTLPKPWLIHTVVYKEDLKTRDDYGNQEYAAPIEIKNVRFDLNSIFGRGGIEETEKGGGVLFVDGKHSKPLPEFVLGSIIEFESRSFVVKNIIPCYHPTKNTLNHYELEVV